MIADPRGNLTPDRGTFVGRHDLLKSITHLVPHVQLLTLTGPGGVGKTRLAIRAGNQLPRGVADRSWLVDFSTIRGEVSTAGLYAHMALAMGIRHHSDAGLEVILTHLRDRRALLVLDSCEHLVPEIRVVTTALLQATTQLRVIAASRERLGVDGERVVKVPPLNLSESVQLFLQLTAKVGVSHDVLRLSDIEALCQRLDGLPLAIELAAGRAGALTTREIEERLADRFALLSDASAASSADSADSQHARLESVVEWSYELCTPAEQAVWIACSVFPEAFTMVAAEAVAADADVDTNDVVDAVTRLVDKSVFTRVDGEPARFRLLETLREYGFGQLERAGRTRRVRDRHRDYHRDLLARDVARWFGADELIVLARVRRNLPDILAAIDHSIGVGDLPAARALARDLARSRAPHFWGFLDILVRRLERVIALSETQTGNDLDTYDLVATLASAAWIAATQGRHEEAERLLNQARSLLAKRDLPTIAPLVFAAGGSAALLNGSREAIGRLADARDLFAGKANRGDRHMATMMWAIAAGFADDIGAAEAACQQLLEEAEQAGAPWAISWALWAHALAALRAGRHGPATESIDRALRLQRDMTDLWGQTWSIHLRARIIAATVDASTEDEARRAAWLLGAASARQKRLGVVLSGLRPLAAGDEQAYNQIVAVLGEVTTAEVFAAGARDNGHALRIALGEAISRRASASPATTLTAREAEIAILVAEGRISREIASALQIRPRTVDTHISNISTKLGLANRAALAGWVAANRHELATSRSDPER
ncbi:LuxR C-terminal-related transcriptional regulator [Actinoplanes subtropicus]|uniref:LuxR C-terminal-related transcriptional regulator n=1 Tax=Actinoplanes subtropicus TaxID=543632 RepID=UPI0004C35A15|nr:LuxR C-terminal-related transcriptional regulator [Actinoplanes subtropicus]